MREKIAKCRNVYIFSEFLGAYPVVWIIEHRPEKYTGKCQNENGSIIY